MHDMQSNIHDNMLSNMQKKMQTKKKNMQNMNPTSMHHNMHHNMHMQNMQYLGIKNQYAHYEVPTLATSLMIMEVPRSLPTSSTMQSQLEFGIRNLMDAA